MRKIFLLFLSISFFSGCTVWANLEHENIILHSNIIVLDNESVCRIDLSTLSEERYSIEEYSKTFSQDVLIVENSNLIRIKNGKKEILFSTDKIILGTPTAINNNIYFIAFSEGDNSNAYLYAFENNQIKRFWDLPVSASSDILVYGNKLFFVEATSKRFEIINNNSKKSIKKDDFQWNSRVICKNVISGETDFICNGENICWKIPGEEMFVSTLSGGFKLLNLNNNTFEIIDEGLNVFCSPIYNVNEDVLFIVANNEKGTTSSVERSGFYYLDKKKFITWETYLDTIEKQNEYSFDSILCWE